MTSKAMVSTDFGMMLPQPIGSLDSYIQTVNNFPMLSADEERELGEQLQQQQDLNAAGKLVLSHLRFVVHIARGYSGYGLPLGDLVQEGNLGLMKAVKRFDPTMGVRLVSYAVHWIRAEIHEFILRNWRIVKVATTKAQRKLFFNLRSSKKRLGWFSHEEVALVARDLGVKPETVLEMEARLSNHDVTYDQTPDSDDDEHTSYSPSAYLNDMRDDPANAVEADDWESSNTEKLYAAIQSLDERSRDILQSRWIQEEKATLHTLADKYSISAERVRQLEANAMKKLKGLIEVE